MTKPAPTLAELLDHDPVLLAAAYAPVNIVIDQLWSDHERYMRKRYADVYELGDRLIREREMREASQKPPREAYREKVGDRSRKIGRILARDGDNCCYCKRPLGDDMTLEHRVAQSRGGTDDLGNLKLAHASCNQEVGNLPVDMKDELAKRKPQAGPIAAELNERVCDD